MFSEHLDCLPKVLMIEAEFDYFKICNEEFVKKLEEQGKDVDVIYYEGLDHGSSIVLEAFHRHKTVLMRSRSISKKCRKRNSIKST